MTRDNLSNFVRAAEHSSSLRRKLRKCTEISGILKLANDYGFKITIHDIKNEENLSIIDNWFSSSRISLCKNSWKGN